MYYQETIITNVQQNMNSVVSEDFDAIIPFVYMTDNIYGQVILNPVSMNFGQVTGDVADIAVLWNADYDDINLTEIIEEGFDGVSINGKTSGIIPKNGTEIYTISVSAQGGRTINAKAKFDIDGYTYRPTLSIFGSRAVLFAFNVDYSNTNSITYSYKTEVQTFYTGREERHQVLAQPQMRFTNTYLANKKDARDLKNKLQNAGSDNILVPIYQHSVRLTQDIPAGTLELYLEDLKPFRAGQLIFLGRYYSNNAQNEIISVDEANGRLILKNPMSVSFTKNDFCAPIVEAMLSDNNSQIEKITDDVITSTLSFSVHNENNNDILLPNPDVVINTFDGLDVLDMQNDFKDMAMSFDFTYEDFNDFGGFERIVQERYAKNTFSYSYLCFNQYDIDYLKEFYRRHKGRLAEFYVSTYYNDFKIAEDIQAIDTTILVENNNQAGLNPDNIRRDVILIELFDGTRYIKKVSNFLTENAETEKVVLFENFGELIKKESVRRIGFLLKCRFNTDELSIPYITYNKARINLSFKAL